jgi:Icc-related predicted phosphoesterase
MRVLATTDLHFNHPTSHRLAEDVIAQMNRAGGDVLLLAGDTGVADGKYLEQCLSQFHFAGPKLFLCGNHELWTARDDSYRLFTDELPARIEAMGWQWLETRPLLAPGVAIVGTMGWYDYSFASPLLNIPKRFYQAKLSPGAAKYFGREDLFEGHDDVPPHTLEIMARWNDAKHVKLHRTDEQFVEELLAKLSKQLDEVAGVAKVVVATHLLPFRELLPPSHSLQWEFTKAYLGSRRLGDVILRHKNVTHTICGHSHLAAEATIQHVKAINIGSTYKWKTFRAIEVAE